MPKRIAWLAPRLEEPLRQETKSERVAVEVHGMDWSLLQAGQETAQVCGARWSGWSPTSRPERNNPKPPQWQRQWHLHLHPRRLYNCPLAMDHSHQQPRLRPGRADHNSHRFRHAGHLFSILHSNHRFRHGVSNTRRHRTQINLGPLLQGHHPYVATRLRPLITRLVRRLRRRLVVLRVSLKSSHRFPLPSQPQPRFAPQDRLPRLTFHSQTGWQTILRRGHSDLVPLRLAHPRG